MSLHLTLYSRPGCHLCDDMKRVIDRVAGRIPVDVRVIDLSGDAALEAEYGSEIPVLLLEGKKVAKYRIGEQALEAVLRGRPRSST